MIPRRPEPTSESTPWTEAKPDLLLTNDLDSSLYNLQRKSSSILNRASIFICSSVAGVLKELIHEISIRAMNFDAIEPSYIYRVRCRCGIELNVFLDFWSKSCVRIQLNQDYTTQGYLQWIGHEVLVCPGLLSPMERHSPVSQLQRI